MNRNIKRLISVIFGTLAGLHLVLPAPQYAIGPSDDRRSQPAREQRTNTSPPGKLDVYDPDPNHLWNRLYRSLFIRVARNGREYGYDELDPLFWDRTKHLLGGSSHQRAINLLDEFLSTNAEQLIADPRKRALLQHDLWAIFDWSSRGSEDSLPQKRELQIRLAQAIRRLALPKEQLEKLPDNYVEAVTSKVFATSYNPNQPQAAFLPPDLFLPAGPWVSLSVIGGDPVAPGHVSGFSGRSVFRVFMRLPGGRQATLAYIKELRDFPKLWIQHPQDADRVLPNPTVPEFPAGTQLALVRQMILIDDQGHLTPTNLTEEVQIRVHRAIPDKIPEAVSIDLNEADRSLDVLEFKLSRERLFSRTSGGLRAITRDEKEFPLFSTQGEDPFEGSSEQGPSGRPILSSCAHCHFRPGIHAVLMNRERQRLIDSWSTENEAGSIIAWKYSRYDWGLLQGLWELQPTSRPR